MITIDILFAARTVKLNLPVMVRIKGAIGMNDSAAAYVGHVLRDNGCRGGLADVEQGWYISNRHAQFATLAPYAIFVEDTVKFVTENNL